MIIPIRTDYRMTRRPWVNYLIVAANIIIFVMSYTGTLQNHGQAWLLRPDDPQLYQFFTSVFMHAGWTHLIGNMIFLWVFGNAVNDRFGQAGYLAFYLAGGILACIGYLLLGGTSPILGASGAISAVTGAYLVLLPRARVTVLVWLFYLILPLEISSLYFLLFQFIWNVVMSYNDAITSMPGAGAGGVAYAAHSSGYVFGIAVAAILLATKVLPPNRFDLLNLVRQQKRRNEYRQMVSQGYNPFIGQAVASSATAPLPSPAREVDDPRELELRREISQCLADHDLPGATARYVELAALSPQTVLSRQQQLDLANQLMAAEKYEVAANAYERFLKHYGNYEQVADIYLMLGLLYGRYLDKSASAEHYLGLAIGSLTDPRKIELARKDLQALKAKD